MAVTRRDFVKRSAAFGGLLLLPGRVLGKDGAVAPNEKLNIATIGCGGRAMANIGPCRKENLVGFCDVDSKRAAAGLKVRNDEFPQAGIWTDYRKMLDELGDQVDAVLVSTPDHTHAHAALWAMRAGKHVYCEKPLAHSIWEARLMAEAAAKYGVVTQMGNQGHSFEGMFRIREWYEAGLLGTVEKVELWSNRSGDKPVPQPGDVPANLDWDLWLGPAEARPYSSSYVPGNWRWYWDFGCGALGDIGCHTLDIPHFALGLGVPEKITATSEGGDVARCPKRSILTYEFGARGDQPPVKVIWRDGGHLPERPADLDEDFELNKEGGAIFYGSKATLYSGGMRPNRPFIMPLTKHEELQADAQPKVLPRAFGGEQHSDWLNACKTGGRAVSDFAVAAPLAEVVLLGNVALRAGAPIVWDAEKMVVTSDEAANQYVRSHVRKGWEMEA